MKNTQLNIVRTNAGNLKFECAMGLVPHAFTWQGAKGNCACINADRSPYPLWPAWLVGAWMGWIRLQLHSNDAPASRHYTCRDHRHHASDCKMKRKLNYKFALEVWTVRHKRIANARISCVMKPASVTIKQWYSLFGETQLLTWRNELR